MRTDEVTVLSAAPLEPFEISFMLEGLLGVGDRGRYAS